MNGLNTAELQKNQTMFNLDKTTYKTRHTEHDVDIEVGDEKQVDFKPRVKIKKWDNEANFSVGVIDNGEIGTHSKKDNKIVWKQGKSEAHFYPVEDGFEFEVILSEKPTTNKVELSIQTKGLKFLYQPILTEEQLLAKEINRPENVEGSYAVYHKTKKDDYSQVGGKNYKTGKAFHIYRPRIIDADGKWAWGELNIDEKKGILTVTIPQSILDGGVYPLIVDPTFGYTVEGETETSAEKITGQIIGSKATGAAGTATKITAYISWKETDDVATCGIYTRDSDISGTMITNGQTSESISGIASSAWLDFTFPTNPAITAVSFFIIVSGKTVAKAAPRLHFDTGSAGDGVIDAYTYDGTLPDSFTDATSTDCLHSIYVTYTEAPTASPIAHILQMI